MALPTTNLTFHAKADVNSDVWVNYQGGSPYHNTAGADGDNIQVWADADGKALAMLPADDVPDAPTYRVSTPLMGLPCLDFNGSNEFVTLYANDATARKNFSDIFGVGAKTIIASIYIEGVTTNDAAAWENEGIFTDGGRSAGGGSDAGGYCGLYSRNTGSAYKVIAFNLDGNEDKIELDVSLNTSYVVTYRHDGTNIYCGLNGAAASSVASGNTTSLDGQACIGRNYSYLGSGNKFFNGRIGEIACYNACLTGTNLTDANSYFTDKWLVSEESLACVAGMKNFPKPKMRQPIVAGRVI